VSTKSLDPGRFVVINGSASEIDKPITVSFAARGYYLNVTDLFQNDALKFAQNINVSGNMTDYRRLFYSDVYNLIEVTEEIKDKFGTTDVLINSAGVLQARVLLFELQTENGGTHPEHT